MNIMLHVQYACLVVNPITICSFGSLFYCMVVGQASDSTTPLNINSTNEYGQEISQSQTTDQLRHHAEESQNTDAHTTTKMQFE